MILIILISVVGIRVIKIAVSTSLSNANNGVAIIGKPNPIVPWTKPANKTTDPAASSNTLWSTSTPG